MEDYCTTDEHLHLVLQACLDSHAGHPENQETRQCIREFLTAYTLDVNIFLRTSQQIIDQLDELRGQMDQLTDSKAPQTAPTGPADTYPSPNPFDAVEGPKRSRDRQLTRRFGSLDVPFHLEDIDFGDLEEL